MDIDDQPSFEEVINQLMLFGNSKSTVEFVKSSPSSVNLTDDKGRTFLHVAVSKSDTALIEFLLSHGANPQSQDCMGNTPMHIAVISGKSDIVKFLLNNSQVPPESSQGRDPMFWAKSRLNRIKEYWITHQDTMQTNIEHQQAMMKLQNEFQEIIQLLTQHQYKNTAAVQQIQHKIQNMQWNSMGSDLDDLESMLSNLSI